MMARPSSQEKKPRGESEACVLCVFLRTDARRGLQGAVRPEAYMQETKHTHLIRLLMDSSLDSVLSVEPSAMFVPSRSW